MTGAVRLNFQTFILFCLSFLVLVGCQGKLRFSTDGGQVRSLFNLEIHPGLQESCVRCHDPLSSDPGAKLFPFAQSNESAAYEVLTADPGRLQRMIERIEGREHPEPSYLQGRIKDSPEGFVAQLKDLQDRLCKRDNRFCPKPAIYKDTTLVQLEDVPLNQFKYVRFDLGRLGFPGAQAEIGYTRNTLSGLQFGRLRIHSPGGALEVGGVTLALVTEDRGETITLLAPLPSITVPQADQPTPSVTAPMAGINDLMLSGGSANESPSSIPASELPLIKLKFGAINYRPQTPQQRFLLTVKPILSRSCLGCHAGGNPGASAAMSLGTSGTISSDTVLYTTVGQRILQGDVANSKIIQKAGNGSGGHLQLLTGTDLAAVRDWILAEGSQSP
ncbi:hypothetical protein EBR78_02385 [bacterium]|nr:hypothetical protein [bacterium]